MPIIITPEMGPTEARLMNSVISAGALGNSQIFAIQEAPNTMNIHR